MSDIDKIKEWEYEVERLNKTAQAPVFLLWLFLNFLATVVFTMAIASVYVREVIYHVPHLTRFWVLMSIMPAVGVGTVLILATNIVTLIIYTKLSNARPNIIDRW